MIIMISADKISYW